jgi:hypothetical protein
MSSASTTLQEFSHQRLTVKGIGFGCPELRQHFHVSKSNSHHRPPLLECRTRRNR